jgi:hypothetical protein
LDEKESKDGSTHLLMALVPQFVMEV